MSVVSNGMVYKSNEVNDMKTEEEIQKRIDSHMEVRKDVALNLAHALYNGDDVEVRHSLVQFAFHHGQIIAFAEVLK